MNKFMPALDGEDLESGTGDSQASAEALGRRQEGQKPPNPFLPFQESSEDQSRDRLGFSIRDAVTTDPDRQARVIDLSRRADIPAAVVDKNFEDVEKKSRLADIDLDGLANDAPKTASFLSDPDNAKLAHDDISSLAASERHAGRIRESRNSTLGNLGRGIGERFFKVAGGGVRFFGTLAATADEVIDDLADFLEERLPLGQIEIGADGIQFRPSTPADIAREDRIFQALTDEAAGSLEATDFGYAPGTSWEDVKDRPLSNFMPFALEQGIVSAPDMAAVLINLPLYVAARTGEIGQTRAVNDTRDTATVGDFVAAAPAAIGSALLERLGARGILGLDDAVKTFRDVPGAVAKATTKETLTEAGQETLESTGETLGTERGFDIAETAERALAGAVGGGPFGGATRTVTGTAQAASRYFGDVSKANKAADAQDLIDEAAEQARNSKLRRRSPDKYREHLEQAAPDTSVFVATDALVELFQSAPEASAALAESVEDFTERMQEAEAGDGFLEISYADFMAHVAGLEEFDGLIRENTKFGFDEFTTKEADAFRDDIGDIVAAEVDTLTRTAGAEQNATAAANRAGDRVQEQLTRAGRAAAVAQDEAAAHRAFARVLQERYGLTDGEVDTLYGNVSIKGELPASVRALPVDQLDLLLDRIRNGSGRTDGQTFGESLVDFVRRLGINDDRGDLAGMDIDAELAPFIKRALRDDGLSIDDVALAAQEAGFFPGAQLSEGDRIDVNMLLEAIGDELAGNPLFQENAVDENEVARRTAAEDLARELERRGIDIEADNATIKAALEAQEDLLFQSKPIVALSGEELGVAPDAKLADVRRAAKDWYKANLRGRKVESSIGEVRFSNKGTKAISSNPDVSTLRLIPAVESVIVSGDYKGSMEARAARPDGIVRFHRFEGDVALDGQAVRAAVLVGEDAFGNLFYDLGKTIPPGTPGKDSPGSEGHLEQSPAPDDSIAQDGPDFNLEVMGQPDGGASSRGSIQFLADDKVVVNLSQAADLSTFLHESGHFFVRTLENIAPNSAAAQRDLDAMLKFVGAENAEQFAETEKQEKLARAFEAYLREGKAPSVELQSAFRRFKSWLVSVYRELLNLDVELTPEIRRTFDRMLATDEEIEAAEGFNRYTVDYGLADLLSDTERTKLETAAQAATDTAKETLLKRKIAEREREATKTWKTEYAAMRAEVRSEINSRPVYRAIDLLRDKEAGLKIDREVVADLLGDEALARLPRGLTGKTGVHPDVVADMVGVASGDALLLDLMNAAPNNKARADLVAEEASARMKERHGSLDDNKRQAAEAANDIVLSDDRAKFIALELRLLREKAGDTLAKAAARDVADTGAVDVHADRAALQDAEERTATTEGATDAVVGEAFEKERAEASKLGRRAQRAATRQTKAALQTKPAVIREAAKQIIARNKVDDAIKPGRFATASQRNAKDAALAIARRDYPAAAEAKRKQLLNHYLAIEAGKARKEVETARKYLDKFSNRRRTFKGVDADYVDKIRTITSAYQVGPRLSNRRRSILELRAINEWMQAQAEDEGALLDIPQEILAADEGTHYRDLSLDDFRALRDTVKNIEAQGRLKKKLLIGGEEKDLAEAVAEIVGAMSRMPETGRAKRRAMEQNPGGGDRILGGLATADAALMKVEFILEALDGKRNGPFHKLLFQPFADAAARSADMTKDITKTVMDAIDNLPKLSRKRLHEKVTVPSMGRTFQRSDLIMMALNTGNESNLEKMIDGSRKDASPGAVPWTEQSVEAALDNLTKEEMDLVQKIWDTFETMYPEIEAIHRREYGVAPERVEVRTVKTKHGDYRGGYFPLMYDTARTSQARDIEVKTALEAMQSESVKASVNSSMTKGRTGFSAPVLLRLDALPSHIDRTVHYITHYDAVRSSRKLLANGEINKAVTNKLGPEYYDALKDWVGAIATNGQDNAVTTPIGKVVEAMRTNATVAIMGLSYTTMAAQVLGYANSIDALARNDDGSYSPAKAARWLLSGLVQYAQHPGKIKKQVFAKSGEMRHRFENVDRELRHSMKKLQGKKGAWKQMQRFSLMGIAGIQLYVVDFPVWLGAYNKAISEGMNDADAVKRADSIVRTSQTAGGIKDLSAIQRKKGVTTALTMFYSYFNLLYNMERQVVGETKKVRDIPRLAARVALLIAVPAVVDELFRQRGPDDDEDVVEWTALKSAIYAMSSVPLLRDFVGLASGFGFSLSPIDGLGEGLGRSVKAAAKAIDEGEPLSASGMKALVNAIGFGVGAPATQINRAIDAADAADKGYDVGPYDFLTGYTGD